MIIHLNNTIKKKNKKNKKILNSIMEYFLN